MDAPDDVPMLEAIAISDVHEIVTADGGAGVNLADSRLPKEAGRVSTVNKENNGAQRADQHPRSSALGAILFGMRQSNSSSEADTHTLLASTDSLAAAAVSRARPLTATYVCARTVELFPGGTSVPAVKPRQPPVVVTPTYELASLCFAAAANVPLIRGKLAREEAAAHILTDLLGIELLAEEALKLGESVRRAAQSIEDRTVAQKKAATAKASRLRVAAAKDVAREARLDEELRQLNEQTEKACAHLRATQVKLNGLPAAGTRIVERRAPSACARSATNTGATRIAARTAARATARAAAAGAATSAAAGAQTDQALAGLARGGRGDLRVPRDRAREELLEHLHRP